jgi:hypothetical protein
MSFTLHARATVPQAPLSTRFDDGDTLANVGNLPENRRLEGKHIVMQPPLKLTHFDLHLATQVIHATI